MCRGNTATVVENVTLEHLHTGNNGHIKWCPGAIRSMYAHLATHKLDPRTCQHDGMNSLLAKLNCIHENSDYPSLVNPRIVRKLRSLISELVDMGILKQGRMRTVVWPQWTHAWTLPSWTGDIGPPSVVPGEEYEQLEVPKAPVAAGDDDVMSWVQTETSSWGPPYQRPPSALQMSSGLSTSTFAPTFRVPAPSESSRGTNLSSSGLSTSTFEPTLRLPSAPPTAQPHRSTISSSGLSASTFAPTLRLPSSPEHAPPSSGVSTSTFRPSLQLPSPKRGIAASRFNSHPAPDLHDGRSSIHPSESASVAHTSRRRLAHGISDSGGPPPPPPPPPTPTRPDPPPPQTPRPKVPLPEGHGDTAHSDQLEASRERLDGLIARVKEIQLVMISERESDMISILESIQRAIVTGQRMDSVAPLVQELDSLCRGQACEVQQPGQDRQDRQELSDRLREAQLGVTELRAALAVGDSDVIVRVEGLGLEEGKNGTADVHLLTQQLDHLVMTGS
ncbi:hypothetical protein GQ607_011752 [Colletotrichum asianum]|uniref:Uncharacterized protein n=1 Tax=Colletotrichum asianum TaxID=702518 RepID=A0A8H3ZIF7_9PEZI|nr:hypothetical protein GQ607_011752 [Colletotrichum asianum]